MVRTGNVDFSCKRLTSIEIRKSKYHIIRRVRFRWDLPPRERYLDPRLLRIVLHSPNDLISRLPCMCIMHVYILTMNRTCSRYRNKVLFCSVGPYSPTCILKEQSLSFSPRFCKFESNTSSDWLDRPIKEGSLIFRSRFLQPLLTC